MHKRISRAAGIAAACVWLAACGGGGDGGNNSNSSSASGGTGPVNPPSQSATVNVAFSSKTLSATATPDAGATTASTNVSITGSTKSLYVAIGSTLRGVAIATVSGSYLDALQIDVRFKEAGALPDGTYADTLTFEVCEDDQCVQQVAGSPFKLPATLTVAGSSAGFVPRSLAAPTSLLSHDVTDAVMDVPLGAIVMASTQPSNALIVRDLATGAERSVALLQPPTSLSLSPDGLRVAVGQVSRISLVDLAPSTPAIVSENSVPMTVFDLVLDGDVVQAFAAGRGWDDLWTEDFASGTRLPSVQVEDGKRARRHPDGLRMYLLDTESWPSMLTRYALSGGVPAVTATAPYRGEHTMCGNFWFSASGDRIFTACGNVFSADAAPSRDMLYQAQLPLTVDTHPFDADIITSLDHDAESGRIALLDAGHCGSISSVDNGGNGGCATLLRLIDDRDYHTVAAYWTVPVYRDGEYRVPHGLFVFHAPDGSLRVIGRLAGVTDATHAFYLDTPALGGSGQSSTASTNGRRAAAQ